MYGATAPSGPWPPSKNASILPYFQLLSSILLSSVTFTAFLFPYSLVVVYLSILSEVSLRLSQRMLFYGMEVVNLTPNP
jgi:hypothetical protein